MRIPFYLLLVLLAGCASNSNLTSSFGTRKYTKGVFRDTPDKVEAKTKNKVTDELIPKPENKVAIQQSNKVSATAPSNIMLTKSVILDKTNKIAVNQQLKKLIIIYKYVNNLTISDKPKSSAVVFAKSIFAKETKNNTGYTGSAQDDLTNHGTAALVLSILGFFVAILGGFIALIAFGLALEVGLSIVFLAIPLIILALALWQSSLAHSSDSTKEKHPGQGTAGLVISIIGLIILGLFIYGILGLV